MILLAIDPGPTKSGWVIFDCQKGRMNASGIYDNDNVRLMMKAEQEATWLVIEAVTNYGMIAGATLFDTAEWIGRFIEAWGADRVTKIPRPDVLKHLTGRRSGKTADLIYELTKRYGGKGTKKAPGPLYGIASHAWSALALATTYKDTIYETEKNKTEAEALYRSQAISAKEVEAACGYYPTDTRDNWAADEAD